jgi:hypothetical protein
MKSQATILAVLVALACAGCDKKQDDQVPMPSTASPSPPTGLPDVVLATTLPQFASEINEIQIADSFNDVDPTWVIGALVDLTTGKIFALDNYLKSTIKPIVTPQTEVVFRSFIDNGVAASAQWLEFVKAEVNDATRVEVAVTKSAKVTVDSQGIDKDQLLRQLRNNKISPRENYGVVIGFTNYSLAATYFRNSGASGAVSGYGAKIGGSWYSKSEHSKAHHRIVAVWSPLPFVVEAVSNRMPGDLESITSDAIKENRIKVQPVPGDMVNLSRIQRGRI